MLACDGTHIGISMCNMKLDKPVTAPDLKDTIIKPHHKRKKWLIIPLKEPRLHLRYLSKKYLKNLKPSEILTNDLEVGRMGELLQYVSLNCPVAFYEVLLVFAQQTHILYILPGDAAMSSLLPFKCHDLLLSICNEAMMGIFNNNKLQEMKLYCIEFA